MEEEEGLFKADAVKRRKERGAGEGAGGGGGEEEEEERPLPHQAAVEKTFYSRLTQQEDKEGEVQATPLAKG